jgi:hypothetical protein
VKDDGLVHPLGKELAYWHYNSQLKSYVSTITQVIVHNYIGRYQRSEPFRERT